MAISNHERIGKALDQLAAGLKPFVERELQTTYQDSWFKETQRTLTENQLQLLGSAKNPQWDTAALLVTGERRRSRVGERIAHAMIVRTQASRAGFYFGLATVFRSKTHRLTLACAAAVGLALSLVVLSRTDLQAGVLTAVML
jgi:hypothetical protein